MLRPHGHIFRSGSSLLPDEAQHLRDGLDGRHLLLPAHPGPRQPGHDHVGAPQLSRPRARARAPHFRPARRDGRLGAARHTVSLERRARPVPVVVRVRSRSHRGQHRAYAPRPIRSRSRSSYSRERRSSCSPRPTFPGSTRTERPGPWTPEPDGLRVTPPVDSPTAEMFPGGSVHLGWTPGSAELDDDATPVPRRPLARAALADPEDGGHGSTGSSPSLRTWSNRTRPAGLTRSSGGLPPVRSRVHGPDTPAGRELDRIGAAVPWFTHDALIHYLSPRGLEQYTGGGWGTRDVTQGPVGLLLTLGAHTELRSLVLLIMQAQNVRAATGRSPSTSSSGTGRSDSRTRMAMWSYWPLLALGQYLAATGDRLHPERATDLRGRPRNRRRRRRSPTTYARRSTTSTPP